jgi:hypothetical protein
MLNLLQSDVSLLKGAAYDGTTYYLATAGSGIFTITDPSSGEPQLVNTSGYNNIVGIIRVGDKIVAVNREDGYILYGNASGFTMVDTDASLFTGALAIYKKDDTRLLLLGIQGKSSTSTVHGYREILLNSDGTLDTAAMSLRSPGENKLSSVADDPDGTDDYERYKVTIGKQPLSSIIQAPNGRLFATTTKEGLWSYKERGNGTFVWNAED